jgi:hypothetical protein
VQSKERYLAALRSVNDRPPNAELSAALGAIVGDGDPAASPLAPGLMAREGNWRAGEPTPSTLPHHPMVLHRGGYPDGS